MSTVVANAAYKAAAGKAAPRDSVREVLETVVFVVALVLLLKLFVVEAFVIPTGSMAETLLGYNKVVDCPECGYRFPVNATSEVEPWDGRTRPVTGGTCPNCRRILYFPDAAAATVRRDRDDEGAYRDRVAKVFKDLEAAGVARADSADLRSGDRVLVHKALYGLHPPERGDVVVFKFPVDPQIKHTAQNYIKRLWGLGGETIAIFGGDLYVARGLEYPPDPDGGAKHPQPEDPLNAWEGREAMNLSKTDPPFRGPGLDYTYHNSEVGPAAFKESRAAGFRGGTGRFELIRKSDAQALSMRRIVYDNEHQSKFLAAQKVPPRWSNTDGGWTRDNDAAPKTFTHAGSDLGWVRYQHRLAGTPTPQDQQGPDDTALWDQNGRQRVFVNDWQKVEGGYRDGLFTPSLITNFLGYNAGIEDGAPNAARQPGTYWVGDLMVECTAKVSGPADEAVLELSKGANRFQAQFTNGTVTLVRTGPLGREMATRPTAVTKAGTYALRFANFDCRLRVWVDGTAVDFGTDGDYSPSDADGAETRFAGLAGGVLAGLDGTQPDGHAIRNDVLAPASLGAKGAVEFGKVRLWQDTFFTPVKTTFDDVDTFYVQPGHYLCLGDNSGQSSDGRFWGLVPERLMLGKAVFVFWPFSLSYNRIGFIR